MFIGLRYQIIFFHENIYMLHKYNHELFIIITFLFSSYCLRNLSKHDTEDVIGLWLVLNTIQFVMSLYGHKKQINREITFFLL